MSNTLKNAVVTPILMLIVMTVVLGVIYPLAITAFGGVVFPAQAGGSLIADQNGITVGSSLIAQNFTSDIYFWPRPSAVNYGVAADGSLAASGGSNLGPTSATLLALIQSRATAIRQANHLAPDAVIPSDLLFASASGLDPQISPEAARLQIDRVAAARGVSPGTVAVLVSQFTEGPQFLMFGQPRVNVLLLNLALDKAGYFQTF
jgi:K+-transporting ATPase ATPase C chain